MKWNLLLLPLVCLCCSCAFTKPENRHLVPLVEKHLVPEQPHDRLLAAPLWVPVGVAAGMLDVFVVHPVFCVDDAYESMMDALWRDVDVGYVTYCGALPFRVAATPVVFGGGWVARSMFPIDPWEPRKRSEGAGDAEEKQKSVLKRLLSDDPRVRLAAAKRLRDVQGQSSKLRFFKYLVDACKKHEADAVFCAAVLRSQKGCWNKYGDNFIYRFTAERKDAVADAKDFIELAARLARRKERELRRAALGIVRGFALDPRSYVDDAHKEIAMRAFRSLYDLYVKEGDHAAEMMCYWVRNRRDRLYDLISDTKMIQHVLLSLEKRGSPTYAGLVEFRMIQHVLLSLEKRGSPTYAGLVEFRLQSRMLGRRPEMIPHAVRNRWRAARGLKDDWDKRVTGLLRRGWPKSSRREAEATARKVIGVRAPSDAETKLLMAHPEAVLKIALQVDKRPLDPEKAAAVRDLIFQLRTQVDAMEFVNQVADLSDEDFGLLRSCADLGKLLPKPTRRPVGSP